VAEQLNMPVAFTSKILQELARKKIIQSVKGPHGGFWLTEENKLLPLLEIVTAVDSTTFFTDCCLGKNHCSNEHPCPVHTDFKSSREAIYHLFKSKTIKEAAREVKVNDSYIIDI
jgi:Rrf2 family protein